MSKNTSNGVTSLPQEKSIEARIHDAEDRAIETGERSVPFLTSKEFNHILEYVAETYGSDLPIVPGSRRIGGDFYLCANFKVPDSRDPFVGRIIAAEQQAVGISDETKLVRVQGKSILDLNRVKKYVIENHGPNVPVNIVDFDGPNRVNFMYPLPIQCGKEAPVEQYAQRA